MVTVIKKDVNVQEINKKISELKGAKKFNSKKHSGVIKLDEEPLIVQKTLRDEWE